MRVTVYFNSSYPYGLAATNRVHQICKSLLFNDVDVRLIITNPTELSTNTPNTKTEGDYEGVKFQYLSKSTIRKRNKIIRKIIDYGCYFKMYRHLFSSSKNTDSYIVIGGATTDYRVLIPFLARLIRKKVFLEICEYPFVTNKDGLCKTLKQSLFFNVIVPSYNGFIVISDLLGKDISRKKSKSAGILKIPILSERYDILDSKDSPPFSLPYIIHAGSMYEEKDGITGCLKAFGKARRQSELNILYVIAGDPKLSHHEVEINRIIREEGLENSVIFIGKQIRERLCFYYKHASLAIVNKSESTQNIYGFATKISEYVAFRIPMILTKVGEINNYFKNDFNAILVEPNNIDQLSDAIVYLIRNKDKSELLALNALELLDKEFSPRYNGARLKAFIS